MRDDLPLIVYSRHLPHWRQDGATYFVTFRLADSLPLPRLRELEAIKHEWAKNRGICGTDCQSVLPRRIPREHWETFVRTLMAKVEGWLDEGMGQCWMARPEISQIVIDSLYHFDNDQYELDCYVAMPNHVHGIFRPLRPKSLPLEKILQSRKLWTSREINTMLGRSRSLWEEESFDRIIRDEEHLYRCIHYIGGNPAKAGIPPDQWHRWVRPSWASLGWNFDA